LSYNDIGIRVYLVQYTQDSPKIIASASKMSVSKKEVKDLLQISDEEVNVWIKETFKRKHFSPWEHSLYTFMIEGCSRVCSHQIVRHRIASYTQQSMRYSETYLRKMALAVAEMVKTSCERKEKKDNKLTYSCLSTSLFRALELMEIRDLREIVSIAYVIPPSVRGNRLEAYIKSVLHSTAYYYKLLSLGVSKEDSRFIIPMSVRTKITITMNARELIESFFPLRLCTRAQWEIRMVAWMMLREVNKVHPQLFRYAGPSCVFLENMSRDEPVTLKDLIEGVYQFTINRCPEMVKNKGLHACLMNAYNTLK